LPNYNISIPDAVEDHRSGYALPIWEYLTDKVGESGEVHQSSIAEAVDCSVRTVQRVLEGFKRCNLIEWDSYQGKGRGINIINKWVKRAKEIAHKLTWKRAYDAEARYLKNPYSGEFQLGTTRLDYLGIPDRVITKGSVTMRFIMWRIRIWVKDTHLKNSTSTICGKIFQHLKGKTLSVGKKWLSRLKDSMLTDWDLTDFFVWFYDLINTEEREKKATERSQKLLDSIEEQQKKARQSWEENPPPKLSDYGGSFEKYLDTMEEWKG